MRYSDSGVDTGKEGEFIRTLLSKIKFRRGLAPPLDFHFTALVDIGDKYLAMNTDGVGSKVLVAMEMGKWDTVGIDCMAMNVNDTICVGAEPLACVDYLAIGSYDTEMAKQLGDGLNKAAMEANVEIIGGETASLPDIVKDFDLSGTVVGVVEKGKEILGNEIEAGDLIFGIPSSGIHSNGLTLARKVLDLHEDFHGKEVGYELLKPTRIYVREVLSLLKRCRPHGLAHITGGGVKNILRLKRMRYVLDSPLEPQEIFQLIAERGKVPMDEMYATFNMGMGFAIIAPEECEGDIKREIGDARVVGHVEDGSGVEIPELKIRYERY